MCVSQRSVAVSAATVAAAIADNCMEIIVTDVSYHSCMILHTTASDYRIFVTLAITCTSSSLYMHISTSSYQLPSYYILRI